jgi:cysteine-rich repeat protein
LCDWDSGTCETRSSGDLCNNADPLPTGFFENSYDFTGMTSDYLGCIDCGATRWFSVVQQPGEITSLLLLADFDGYVAFHDQACPLWNDMGAGDWSGFWSGYRHSRFIQNHSGVPRTLWFLVGVADWETPGTFELAIKTGAEGCGDGRRDSGGYEGPDGSYVPNEQCDDMNNADGDGCSADCRLEFAPFRCPWEGPCTPIECGDGIVDRVPNAPFEECDDGGLENGDGCSDQCVVESGALCFGHPSSCAFTPPGDVCSNSLALPDGASNHDLSAFQPDLDCLDTCSGNDMWFSRVLQPREQLALGVSAQFDGQVVLFESGAGGCRERIAIGSQWFASGSSQQVLADNPTDGAITVFAAVVAWSNPPAQGAFTLNAQVAIPALDCDVEPCADVVCGDGVINGTEQCDDGQAVPASGDGCSSACVVETGYGCSGQPSTCQALPEGDTCATAQALVDGVYGLEGFTVDAICGMNCGDPTRWFVVDVPAGHTLWLELATTAPSLHAHVYDMSQTSCHRLGYSMANLYAGTSPSRWSWVNPEWKTARLAIVVADPLHEPSSSEFSIVHTVEPVGCGDGHRSYGYYGPYEECDDGGVADGDGCSATCTVEPGWDCSQGFCEQVVCGDERVTGAEECDDGGTVSGDGCSATCTVESGYLCSYATPSVCLAYREGDLCSNAEPLTAGTHSLEGYIPDLPCDDVCRGADRWFAITLPAGQTFSMTLQSSGIDNGYVEALDATNGCASAYGSGVRYFRDGQPTALSYVNDASQARELRIYVAEDAPASSGGVILDYAVRPIGCGDGYVDVYGWYGPSEECDDGNNLPDDGCSPECQWEP